MSDLIPNVVKQVVKGRSNDGIQIKRKTLQPLQRLVSDVVEVVGIEPATS